MVKKISKLERIEQNIQGRLHRVYSVRLAIVICGAITLLLSVIFNWKTVSFVTIITTGIFFFYFVKTTDAYRLFLEQIKTHRKFLLRQKNRQAGTYRDEEAFPKTGSHLDLDFDLYGKHSLFSQISECFSDVGQKKLASRLENPELDPEKLIKTQRQIHSLARYRWPLLKTSVLAGPKRLNIEPLLKQFQAPFLSEKQKTRILRVIGLWALAIATGIASAWGLNINVSFGLFVLFWTGSIYALGEISGIFFRGLEVEIELEKLGRIFAHLEKVSSTDFNQVAPHIRVDRPSRRLNKLRSTLSFLSIQGNPLVALLLNMVSPWSLYFSYKLEQERQKLIEPLPNYLEDLSELEFYLSLVTMFIYQSQTFPDFTAKPYLETKGIFHPLIGKDKVIKNDFHFGPEESLGLITGSNMSGKSTFLRAVGINHILSMIGAPVFADHFVTYPSHIDSCIRVSDSIADGYSYFYAEVRRLKGILENISRSRPTFFIVDEIFKGTNNQERVEGGRSILGSFLSDHSMGFVTTHDMELALNPPNGVANWHFTDSFEDGQIRFSYKILPGPSTTTNALKIMELEGLFKDRKPRLRPV